MSLTKQLVEQARQDHYQDPAPFSTGYETFINYFTTNRNRNGSRTKAAKAKSAKATDGELSSIPGDSTRSI